MKNLWPPRLEWAVGSERGQMLEAHRGAALVTWGRGDGGWDLEDGWHAGDEKWLDSDHPEDRHPEVGCERDRGLSHGSSTSCYRPGPRPSTGSPTK